MLMMKSMLRKTLNGINDLIVYKFVSNKDKKKNVKIGTLFSNSAREKKEAESHIRYNKIS